MQYIEIYSFKTVEEFLNRVMPWGDYRDIDGYVFRGHSMEHYELLPSALRKDAVEKLWNAAGMPIPPNGRAEKLLHQVLAEFQVLRDFYRLADQRGLAVPLSPRVRDKLVEERSTLMEFDAQIKDLWIPPDLYEAAALAQHYGMPTRLLDWTYDIFVALYFACKGAIDKQGDMCVWALNKEYVSMLRPTEFIEGVDFITPHYSGNPHLYAQKGLFTHVPCPLPHYIHFTPDSNGMDLLTQPVDRRPLDEILQERSEGLGVSAFKKFIIPCSEARKGCRILMKLSYDASRIFPGYGGVAEHLLKGRLR